MSETGTSTHDLGDHRTAVRRGALLAVALVTVSAIDFVLGAPYVWPLFVFPLFLAAVFFFELGSLLVTAWLGAFLVAYYAIEAHASTGAVRQAVAGTTLFGLAGLILGRVQRNHHRTQTVLAASSLTDRLTGLYNYGTFVDYLHNEVNKVDRYGGELTLLMFDLDHFKQFNDRYGHEAGNELLRRIGSTLRAMVRDADMAARYGGEEFAILIRGDVNHGYELAERLRRAVEASAIELRGGVDVAATVSAGVASYPAGAADETQLIEHADGALYESKRRGRNRVTIYAGTSTEAQLSATLTA